MNIIISNSSGQPIYDQISSQIKSMILSGELKEGDALPSMRFLAKELRISVITTKRAYEDLEKDRKRRRFNIWESRRTRRDFDALVENTLSLMMGDCAQSFEVLPIVQDIDILRNILYSGVWMSYNAMRAKEKDKGEKKA